MSQDIIAALRKENAIIAASETSLRKRWADLGDLYAAERKRRQLVESVLAGQIDWSDDDSDLIDEDPPEFGPDTMATIAEQARAVTAIATKGECRYVAVIGGGSRAMDLAHWALRDAGWSPSGGYGLVLHQRITCSVMAIPNALTGNRFDIVWLVGSDAQARRREVRASAGLDCRIFPDEQG